MPYSHKAEQILIHETIPMVLGFSGPIESNDTIGRDILDGFMNELTKKYFNMILVTCPSCGIITSFQADKCGLEWKTDANGDLLGDGDQDEVVACPCGLEFSAHDASDLFF